MFIAKVTSVNLDSLIRTSKERRDKALGIYDISEETLNKIDWTAWIFTPGDIPIQIPENNSYKNEADEIVEKIKNENFDNLDSEFNKLLTVPKVYILLCLWDVEDFLSDKQHKFLTETLGLYTNQNFLISINYFQLILAKTDKFLEHELDSLINYLSNYGASDYMYGIYEEFYKRDEVKAVETLNNLTTFYHSAMYYMALEEIEMAKAEFPILEFNVKVPVFSIPISLDVIVPLLNVKLPVFTRLPVIV